MKILLAASESVPYAKTGGLADVVGALGVELLKQGADASVILPLYRTVRQKFKLKPLSVRFSIRLGPIIETGRIWQAVKTEENLPVYFIENDRFFDRDGLYGNYAGDYLDNASRFIFFSRGVLETVRRLKLSPDVIHCNDWQTGLVPLYMKTLYQRYMGDTASVFTIHNLGYQGRFWHLDMPLLGVGWEHFNMEGIEFYGKINLMKSGIVYSDRLTTVSPGYSREILTEKHGFELHGILRKRRADLSGILNGIDTAYWNPATDSCLPANYSIDNMAGKQTCKAALQRECGFRPLKKKPLIGLVTRLSEQKGTDLVVAVAEKLLKKHEVQMVVLGSGDESIEQEMLKLMNRYKGTLYVKIGFDEDFAHRIYSGSDMFLMPSRYEPCGLGQMIAMRYGTVPVARKTGGLADTVIENGSRQNGYLFTGFTARSFFAAVDRALKIFLRRPAYWKMVVRNGMSIDFSWSGRVQQYLKLYEKTLSEIRLINDP